MTTEPLADSASVFLDALAQPVEVTDARGVLLFVNAAAATRLDGAALVGLDLPGRLSRVPVLRPDGVPLGPAEHPVARVLATGQAVLAARVLVAPPGHERQAWVMNTAPLWSGGRVTGTVSLLHDQSPRSALERQLAEHGARLEAIVNLVSDAVFVVDADGRLGFANSVGERLLRLPLGIDAEERRRRLAIRAPDGSPVAAADLPSVRALGGATIPGVELRVTDPQGVERRVLTRAHPLRRPDGSIYAALVTMKDMTEEARAREALEAARAEAEEASRMKDRFIAALSHELRSPLQPILGWTEVLRRHPALDDVTARALAAIRRNVRQQVRLVDDLLDLSRIVHGKLALRRESVDLTDAVRAAAEPFEEVAALKRVRLTVEVPAAPLPAWADGGRIQQIASNLVSNAVKFTPAGGRVAVRLRAGPREAMLEVEDTGEGIAPEDLTRIFDAFGQAGRRQGGLGLGLDLVRRLSEAHGGRAEAFSAGPGRGARFRVWLPLTEAPAAPPAADADPSRRLEGQTILIIEDSRDTREVLELMLELEGARVETAASGGDGIRAAQSLAPAVVLCDIGLPDIDGLEVARRIRRCGETAAPRLIALTGYGRVEDIREAEAAGYDAHLTKPVNLDQLIALLGE